MLIKTLLNHCHKFKHFVYQRAYLENGFQGQARMIVEIEARVNSKKVCSKCLTAAPGYDTLAPRDFQFIQIWGIPVFFRYARRRVQCPIHGSTVEHLPWANGKSPLTHALKIYLSQWAKHLSWKTVAEIFNVTWQNVFESVEYVVEYGLKNRLLGAIKAIGVDEIQYRLGHRYLTLVYQIDSGCRRLLFVGKGRNESALKGFPQKVALHGFHVVLEQFAEFRQLLGRLILLVLQENPSGVLEKGLITILLHLARLLAAGMVDRLIEFLHDVKAIQDIERIRRHLGNHIEIGLPHVRTDGFQRRAACLTQAFEKAFQGAFVPALSDKE
jgi:hypothetical protein